MNNERIAERSFLGIEHLLYRCRVEGVTSQSVDGFGGEGYEMAGTQTFAAELEGGEGGWNEFGGL